MITVVAGRAERARGNIETLRSGALRVRVYAGEDPFTGKRHYLTEVDPAGRARSGAPGRARPAAPPDRRASQPAHERDRRRAADPLPGPVRRLAEHAGRCTAPTSATTSRRSSGTSRSGSSTPRPWTRSTPSCAAAAHAAAAAARSSTGPPGRTSATSGAARTSAARWPRRRSGTSTSCCPAPTRGPCAGGGCRQPDREGRAAAGAEAEPAAADCGAGCADRHRVVA